MLQYREFRSEEMNHYIGHYYFICTSFKMLLYLACKRRELHHYPELFKLMVFLRIWTLSV